MLKNLDLDLSTSVTLDSNTSDLTAGRTWTPQNNIQTTTGVAWAEDGGNTARSMDPGNIYFPDGAGVGAADANANLAGVTSGEPWEFIGNYYNWYAATAGTGTAAMISGNATDSICPKGWKLPDNTGTKSFFNLITTTYGLGDSNTASLTKFLQAPLNFVRDGFYNWSRSQIFRKGAHGYWWSTAAASVTNAYYLSTDTVNVYPQTNSSKGNGLTIRCVAR